MTYFALSKAGKIAFEVCSLFTLKKAQKRVSRRLKGVKLTCYHEAVIWVSKINDRLA